MNTPREAHEEAEHSDHRENRWCANCGKWFTRVRGIAEVLSFLAVIVTLPLAYCAYQGNLKKERLEAAWGIYREVDHIYRDFAKLCFDNPRLDCYSKPLEKDPNPPLSDQEQLQQRILYDNLTDAFEVAYVHYCELRDSKESPQVRELFNAQWAAWGKYIQKLVTRPAYRAIWPEIRDEYDPNLARYIDNILKDPMRSPPGC